MPSVSRSIAILGSTGSIGQNTLDVIRQHPDRFSVVGLVCRTQLEIFISQICEFHPRYVSVETEELASQLRILLTQLQPSFDLPEVLFGINGAVFISCLPEVDLVVSAMVGAAGLIPTFRALEHKKRVALANKEVLVMAGALMTDIANRHSATLLPIDSEHNAIFQVLQGNQHNPIRRLILTASGGPFLGKTRVDLKTITPAQALNHPRWKMGPKISVDSATLMNKGFELIEAHWLFQIPPEQIEIMIHPESVIHSMVEYDDGSILAQLGIADMRLPIAYALSYPERLKNSLPSLDLLSFRSLHFYSPDEATFRCLTLARMALNLGRHYPCVLNAANEIAVQSFLDGRIGFLQIPIVIEQSLEQSAHLPLLSMEEVLNCDRQARIVAKQVVCNIGTPDSKETL